MPTVGLLDLSGIQDVIFRSNNLPEISSASQAIEQLSTPHGLFTNVAGKHLLVAAGGNLTVTGSTEKEVASILKTVQYELLDLYPELAAVTAVAHYNKGGLLRGYQEALRNLECRKLTAPRSISVYHPGWKQQHSRFQADETDRDATNQDLLGERDLNRIICTVQRGQEGNRISEKSDLMAVISVDGLSMGKRMITWMKAAEARAISDEEFTTELRRWSHSVRDRWNSAWKAATSAVTSSFKMNVWKHSWQERSLHMQNGGRFPYRKIYQGGDDLSFVCDAHVAMAMATHLVRELEKPDTTVPVEFQSLSASVGILFVNNKFPYARAVELADKIRQEAKKRSAEFAAGGGALPSSLSWWLNRQGEMELPASSFKGASQRPYLFYGTKFNLFDLLDDSLPTLWKEFNNSRGLFKSLIEAAQEGGNGEHVARSLRLRSPSSNSTSDNPFGSLPEPFNTPTGFAAGGLGTILLDAGELYDLYFPLEKGQE